MTRNFYDVITLLRKSFFPSRSEEPTAGDKYWQIVGRRICNEPLDIELLVCRSFTQLANFHNSQPAIHLSYYRGMHLVSGESNNASDRCVTSIQNVPRVAT